MNALLNTDATNVNTQGGNKLKQDIINLYPESSVEKLNKKQVDALLALVDPSAQKLEESTLFYWHMSTTTPLITACQNGHLDTVRALLTAPAIEIEQTGTFFSDTAYTISDKFPEIRKWLKAHGALVKEWHHLWGISSPQSPIDGEETQSTEDVYENVVPIGDASAV